MKYSALILALLVSSCAFAQINTNSSDNIVIAGNPAQTSQWPHRGTIQDAVNFAGQNGTVWVPATYAGNESVGNLSNPNNVLIIDLRGGTFKTSPAIPGSNVAQGSDNVVAKYLNGQQGLVGNSAISEDAAQTQATINEALNVLGSQPFHLGYLDDDANNNDCSGMAAKSVGHWSRCGFGSTEQLWHDGKFSRKYA